MYVLYTLCLLLGGLALLPHILWRGLRGATYHHDLAERLGYLPWVAMPSVRGCVWFHAASVGEVQGIKPIIASVHADHPTLPLVPRLGNGWRSVSSRKPCISLSSRSTCPGSCGLSCGTCIHGRSSCRKPSYGPTSCALQHPMVFQWPW